MRFGLPKLYVWVVVKEENMQFRDGCLEGGTQTNGLEKMEGKHAHSGLGRPTKLTAWQIIRQRPPVCLCHYKSR